MLHIMMMHQSSQQYSRAKGEFCHDFFLAFTNFAITFSWGCISPGALFRVSRGCRKADNTSYKERRSCTIHFVDIVSPQIATSVSYFPWCVNHTSLARLINFDACEHRPKMCGWYVWSMEWKIIVRNVRSVWLRNWGLRHLCGALNGDVR